MTKRADMLGNKLRLKHGHTWLNPDTGNSVVSPTYSSWRTMKHTCGRYPGYETVAYCEQWADFAVFLADMGERPAGTYLVRKDPGKDFGKDNCFWGTPRERSASRKKKGNVAA